MSTAVDDDIRADFLAEAGELVERLGEQLLALEQSPRDGELINAVFRAFHTIKGGAGFMGVAPLVDLCHAAEDLFGRVRGGERHVDVSVMDAALRALDGVQDMLDRLRAGQPVLPVDAAILQSLNGSRQPTTAAAPAVTAPSVAAPATAGDSITDDEFEALLDQYQGRPSAKPAGEPQPSSPPIAPAPPLTPAAVSAMPATADTSVRVETHKLDLLMNLVGELVLVRNRIKTLRATGAAVEQDKAVGEFDAITSRLQRAVLTLRMQPIRKLFARFPKLVRELSRSLGKNIQVELIGEDTDLDKNLVEALADPLIHMVRNSCDHGIELPEVRAAAGKPRQGRLTLQAQQEGDHILITVQDDGAGIDPERLRQKVLDKKLMSAAEVGRLDAQAALELIFLPGFSTKESVSDLSGRGVGMDVVKNRIAALDGRIQIESRVGQGTLFRLRLPLTLAILPTLMVTVLGRVHAIPLPAVIEVCALDASTVRWLDRRPVLLLRGQPLPLADLGRWIDPMRADDAFLGGECHVVVVRVGEQRHGLLVQSVLGREEVVIKPLGALLKGLAGFAGATVTGDGRVALILDVESLLQAVEGSA
jgi:two-component system, chemotaxis family, sensor kinase CheA